MNIEQHHPRNQSPKNWTNSNTYNVIITLLAIISIGLAIVGLIEPHQQNSPFFFWPDSIILVIFTIDYFGRLVLATNKWQFFYQNFFDLLAILPLGSIFNFFRLSRLFRLARFFRLIRLIGLLGKLSRLTKKLLASNGFGYALMTAICLILLAASIYAYSEATNFGEAIWWAVTTTTTVGYGDISPQTLAGKIVAIVLMITGIGLIGSLTSAITGLFYHEKNAAQTTKIDLLFKQNQEILERLEQLNPRKIEKDSRNE